MDEMTSTPSRRTVVAGLSALGLIPAATRAASPPIEAKLVVEDGRLWVGAQIGEKLLRFIVDTGAASNFIRPDLATELGLSDLSGGRAVTGIGGRSRVVGNVEARNVIIGGVVRQPRMQFTTYDFGRGLADDAAGLFAAGLVTAYDCDLLLGETMATWRIWRDGRKGAAEGMLLDGASVARQQPRDASERIIVTAMIDGKPYRLLVDTGAPRSLLLSGPASGRSGLWDAPTWAPQRMAGFGGPNARLARTTRATRLDFGPLALKRPFVTLADPRSPALPGVDGIIGLPLITLFDWSFDAGTNRIWTKRNIRKPSADAYRRSGLWIDRAPDGAAIVAAVGAGSPAASVALKLGDRVGRFDTLLPRLDGPAGSKIDVGDKTITLADYL